VSRLFDRGQRVPAEVLARAELPRGEKVLARAVAADGTWLLGTRDALVLVPPTTGGSPVRIPWEHVETAEWERDDERLSVVEVGEFGRPRPVHAFTLADPGPLLPMVRERVTASVLLVRHVPLEGRRGLRVIARRSPAGDRGVRWLYEYDAGIDPGDPVVVLAAENALADARSEVGLD